MSGRRRTLLVGSALLSALVAMACSEGSNDASLAARPIEPILDGEIQIATDPGGQSATLAVETSVSVACAVIYGTDLSFGSIAVDNDMDGGAHAEHRPVLGGLEPDTEYLYVLQGSDEAGNFYRSAVRSFRTPQAPADALDNIAPLATAVASSEYSGRFAATNAIDGDLTTEWSTAGDGDDAWIEVDLGAARPLGGFAFRTRRMSDGSAIVDTFGVTVDGQRDLGPFAVTDGPVLLDEPITARVIRFDAKETTGGNTGAVEVEIYASP